MASFKIKGKVKLSGNIPVSGAKNAALKIIPAAIMANGVSVIKNVPNIIDIQKMIHILESIGAKITFENGTVTIDTTEINSSFPDEKLVKRLRGSIVAVGPLLSRFGKATITQPGGCLIGARAIDDHLDVFKQLGIKIEFDGERYHFSGKPKSGDIILSKMSVTATENAIMASVLSPGVTNIHAAACEPEIADLAFFLNKMGAQISGAGTHDIEIKGVEKLEGVEYEILPDRVEAGTYLMLALATNSAVTIGPVISDHLSLVFKKLRDAGADFEIKEKDGKEYIEVKKHNGLKPVDIDTRPYPGFPTDLQSPYAVLMTQADGDTKIFETMYESRFGYLEELKLMRGNTEIQNPYVFIIHPSPRLVGTTISSRDIRGGAALVIAALLADGETIIEDAEFIDRGYENIDKNLRNAGVSITRLE